MSNLSYCVIDLETSIKNRGGDGIGKMKASPFYKENKIVMFGNKTDFSDSVYILNTFDKGSHVYFDKVDWLVGHNIKFDILYIMRYLPEEWNNFVNRGGRIWDTQLAEYIISGQSFLYPSLDEVSEKYGGTIKDDKIKEYWNNGIDTENIPEEELEEYLKHDVLNTEKVFLKQVHDIFDLSPKLLDHVKMEMEALLCTTEMEFNGMVFDVDRAEDYKRGIEILNDRCVQAIVDRMDPYFPEWYQINPTSNEDISKMLFGGTVKGTIEEPMIDDNGEVKKYLSGAKKGLVRMKKVAVERSVCGFLLPVQDEWRTKKPGVYQVNDGVLQKIRGQFTLEVDQFVGLILEHRAYRKEISTYYTGYSDLVWPDGCIHQSLNHCATVTSRLSCSSPNLQNATNKG